MVFDSFPECIGTYELKIILARMIDVSNVMFKNNYNNNKKKKKKERKKEEQEYSLC